MPKLVKMISQKYNILESIGKGSYGEVFKGVCLNSGRLVALKVLQRQCKTEYDTIKLVREIKLLKKLKSSFVTQLIDVIYP